MQMTEKVVHGSYAVSIAVLSYFVVSKIAHYFHLGNIELFLYSGIIGAILLVLGLFIFKKGLGFGLALAGILCVLQGIILFGGDMTDALRFALACVALVIVGYALYHLDRQGSGK